MSCFFDYNERVQNEKLQTKRWHLSDTILLILSMILAVVLLYPSENYVRFTSDTGNSEDLNVSMHLKEASRAYTDELGSVTITLPEEFDDDDRITLMPASEDYTITAGAEGLFSTFLPHESTWQAQSAGSQKEEASRTPLFPVDADAGLLDVFEYYKEKNYCIVMYSEDDISAGWSQAFADAVKQAGIGDVSADDMKNGWLGIWYQGGTMMRTNTQSMLYKVHAADHLIQLQPVHSPKGYKVMQASIKIDGEEKSGAFSGLNIVVYDPVKNQLIDSLGFAMDGRNNQAERPDFMYQVQNAYVYNSALLKKLNAAAQQFSKLEDTVSLSALLLVLVFWFSLHSLQRRIRKEKSESKAALVIRQILLMAAAVCAGLMAVGYRFLASEFPDMSVDQLVYHYFTNLKGADTGGFSGLIRTLILTGIIIIAVLIVLLLIFIRVSEKDHVSAGKKKAIFWTRWVICFTAVSIIISTISSFWKQYHMTDYIASKQMDSSIFENRYVDPDDVSITFPQNKKNLIYIFMESMEITNADTASGGGLPVNTIRNLTKIALDNTDFNGNSGILDGALPLEDCTWTIAGITAETAGLPLKMDMNTVNNGRVSSMLPGATAIGDILRDNGYSNTIIMGSDASFGNRDIYFKTHGDYDIIDLQGAKDRGWLPQNYRVFWGFEDKKLFSFAKTTAQQLASDGQPFNLTLLTEDTHYPDGYSDDTTPHTFDSTYANVVAGSDQKVSDFVSWVQQQPWGRDTVIVINGDHCFMGTDYFDYIPQNYVRKTYTAIINGQKKEPEKERTYSTMDLFPTTLSALGCTIEGDRLALGTDLYSDTPTMLEEVSADFVNRQISMDSDFYNEEILQGDLSGNG